MLKKFLCALLLISSLTFVLVSCQGEPGPQGEKGVDGATPTIEISDDGYWIINGEKTDVSAKGEKGDKGDKGDNAVAIDENPQGLDFFLKDDGTYAVGIGNAACLSVIVVPSTYRGKAVTEIPNEGFGIDYHGDKVYFLQKIILPDSIKRIGKNVFPNCNTLTDIYYTSDEEAWNSIEIDRGNDELSDATIHFNYVPEG